MPERSTPSSNHRPSHAGVPGNLPHRSHEAAIREPHPTFWPIGQLPPWWDKSSIVLSRFLRSISRQTKKHVRFLVVKLGKRCYALFCVAKIPARSSAREVDSLSVHAFSKKPNSTIPSICLESSKRPIRQANGKGVSSYRTHFPNLIINQLHAYVLNKLTFRTSVRHNEMRNSNIRKAKLRQCHRLGKPKTIGGLLLIGIRCSYHLHLNRKRPRQHKVTPLVRNGQQIYIPRKR